MSNCPDCPDLAESPDRPDGQLRSSCCRDDYIALRRAGHLLAEVGGLSLAEVRQLADRERPNRHERRKREAQER